MGFPFSCHNALLLSVGYYVAPVLSPFFLHSFASCSLIVQLFWGYPPIIINNLYHRFIIQFLCRIQIFKKMINELTFNDLPQVVAELRDEVIGIRQMLTSLQKEHGQRRENTHRPMSVEEAAEYLKIPLRTLYMKLGNGIIPATKPGKRYVLYQDELDKWLECNRKNPVPLTDEEQNAAILAANRRKPNKRTW